VAGESPGGEIAELGTVRAESDYHPENLRCPPTMAGHVPTFAPRLLWISH
jgi:hypothetical protein